MTASQETMPLPTPDAARAHAEATVKRSGTSFAAGMSILSRERREGMHAIYAFCREVDDIADGDQSVVDKRLSLAAWRAEVDNLYAGKPRTPIGIALMGPVNRYGLDRAEFVLMIEGMEMDAEGPIVAPPMQTLLAYTRRVAGAVGMLSMPTFGAPKGEASRDFALALGDALQLTNILRDVAEDAAIGRLYLPKELLEKHGAPTAPADILTALAQASPPLAASSSPATPPLTPSARGGGSSERGGVRSARRARRVTNAPSLPSRAISLRSQGSASRPPAPRFAPSTGASCGRRC